MCQLHSRAERVYWQSRTAARSRCPRYNHKNLYPRYKTSPPTKGSVDQNSKLRHQSRDTFAIKAEVVRFECPGQLHSCADREIFLKSAFCDTFHASVTGSLLDGSSSPPDLGFLLLCAVPRCAASSPGAGRSSRTDATDGRFPEPGAHYRIDTIEPRIVSGHTRRAPEATRIRADAPRRIHQ